LATPLLSPTRLPRTLQALWAQRTLSKSLEQTISPKSVGAATAAASCAEVGQGGHVIFADDPGHAVLPASNMKLITAEALLEKLGPGYRFTTEAAVASPPVDGVVEGNVYIVGGGDPLLRLPSYVASLEYGGPVYTDVTALATLLKAAGLRRVMGSVVGDDSRYDAMRSVPSWPATYAEEGDVGPLSALSVDDGTVPPQTPAPAGAPPPEQVAALVTELLEQDGISVGGVPEVGRTPASAHVLARLVSPPLSQILGEVLRESDNTAMELMTKELGLKVSGAGSTAAGTATVRAVLAADGLPLRGFVNVDGSGLSRLDRVTCALLVAVLERAGAHSVLVRDLPIAGVSGTLADELKGTVAAGRVQAKTGSLNGVKALSGWALPAPGQGLGNSLLYSPVVFSLVLNDLPISLADPATLTDRFALDVAEYPQAPALSVFEPG